MNQQNAQKLADLDQKIKEMKAVGNQTGVAAAHTQKALLYTLAMDLKSAAAEVAKATVIAQEKGRVDELALAHYVRGKTLINQPGQQATAKEAFETAAAIYSTLDKPVEEAKCLQELAAIDLTEEKFKEATNRLSKAIALLNEEEDLPLIIDLYKARSNYHIFQGDVATGLKDLDIALALAKQHQNQDLILTVKLQQQTLKALSPEGASAEDLASLFKQAKQAGNFQIIEDVQLQQANLALQNGDLQKACQLAELTRQNINQSQDLMRHGRYLSASIILATAMEQLKNYRMVLYALLTCKVYLEKHLGKPVGQQMNQILDSLKKRWGAEKMKAVIEDYQTWLKNQQ